MGTHGPVHVLLEAPRPVGRAHPERLEGFGRRLRGPVEHPAEPAVERVGGLARHDVVGEAGADLDDGLHPPILPCPPCAPKPGQGPGAVGGSVEHGPSPGGGGMRRTLLTSLAALSLLLAPGCGESDPPDPSASPSPAPPAKPPPGKPAPGTPEPGARPKHP